MGVVEWNSILTDVLSQSAVLAIGAIGGGVVGYFRGKKKSALGIERKNMIYQPLLDEIYPISISEFDILVNKKMPKLMEIVKNEYKYGLTEDLQEKCNHLYSLIEQFNNINLVTVAHSKIIEIFKNGYEEVFGSITDGISINRERDGTEWEEENLALPIELIKRQDFERIIINLLNNEEIYDREVLVDGKKNIFIPVYGGLVDIFESVLYVVVNGVRNQPPSLKKELGMTPSEYMALNYDFFKLFNDDAQKVRKDKLREDIIFKSQEVVEDLKEVVRRIVETYEKEEI